MGGAASLCGLRRCSQALVQGAGTSACAHAWGLCLRSVSDAGHACTHQAPRSAGELGLPSCSAGPKGPHVAGRRCRHEVSGLRNPQPQPPARAPSAGLGPSWSRIPAPHPGRAPAPAAALTHRAGAGSIRTAEVSPQHGPWRTNRHDELTGPGDYVGRGVPVPPPRSHENEGGVQGKGAPVGHGPRAPAPPRPATHRRWLAAAAGRGTRCSSAVLAAGGTGAVGP